MNAHYWSKDWEQMSVRCPAIKGTALLALLGLGHSWEEWKESKSQRKLGETVRNAEFGAWYGWHSRILSICDYLHNIRQANICGGGVWVGHDALPSRVLYSLPTFAEEGRDIFFSGAAILRTHAPVNKPSESHWITYTCTYSSIQAEMGLVEKRMGIS